MKKIVLASALLLSMSSLQAAEAIRWDSASVSFQSVDIDDIGRLNGFGITGTKLVKENIFITGSYTAVSNEINIYGEDIDVDYKNISVGFGYRHAISSTSDFFGIVSYEDIDVKMKNSWGSESEGDKGFGLEAGIRSLMTDKIELRGSLDYARIGGVSDKSINLSAMYHFTHQFSAGVGYDFSDDADVLSLTATLFY